MLGGGLLCERRNSDVKKSASLKDFPIKKTPSENPASNSCIPMHLNRRRSSNTMPQIQDTFLESTHIFSEQRVSIRDGKYFYNDTALSLVGHGSFGIVFRGHDTQNDEIVAIKKMSRINVKSNELETMRRMSNPNLVSLIDICDAEIEDVTYLIMEMCDTDLDRHLKFNAENGKLDDFELRTVIKSIANGYYALYQSHIVHRDIKPQNLLLQFSRDGTIVTAKLTDFGVSRVLADESKLSNVAGTLFFMSPEVGANLIKMCEYDHLADMWSIGCVAYQCHTGNLPFDECSLCRLFLHFAGQNYDAYDLPPLPDDTRPALRHLIASLLEIDRDKRATAEQFYQSVVVADLLLIDE